MKIKSKIIIVFESSISLDEVNYPVEITIETAVEHAASLWAS